MISEEHQFLKPCDLLQDREGCRAGTLKSIQLLVSRRMSIFILGITYQNSTEGKTIINNHQGKKLGEYTTIPFNQRCSECDIACIKYVFGYVQLDDLQRDMGYINKTQ